MGTGIPRRPRAYPLKTPQIFDYLESCAREKRKTTYGEIAQMTGLSNQGVARPLDYIWHLCERRGLPHLNSIVVNKRTGQPGSGYTVTGDNWRAMVGEVLAYRWTGVGFA